MKLKGKVCIVTGGAAGIGKATALKFAREGAQVVICDRAGASVADAVAGARDAGLVLHDVPPDLSSD